jgi:hypothetical protein
MTPQPWNSPLINAQLAAQRSAAPELLVPLDVALAWMHDRYGLHPGTAPAATALGSAPRTR